MNHNRPTLYKIYFKPDHCNLLLSYKSIELLSGGAVTKLGVIAIVLITLL